MSTTTNTSEKSRAIKRPFQVRNTLTCNDESLIWLDDATLKQYKLIIDQYTVLSLDYIPNCVSLESSQQSSIISSSTSLQDDSPLPKIKIKLYAKIKLDKSMTTKQAIISSHLFEQMRNRILKEFPKEIITFPVDSQLLIYISNQVHRDEIPKCNKLELVLHHSNNSPILTQILRNTKLLKELLNAKSKRYNSCFQSHCIYRIDILEMILYFEMIGYSMDNKELLLFTMSETCSLKVESTQMQEKVTAQVIPATTSILPPVSFHTLVKSITSHPHVPIYHEIISQLIYLILNEDSHIIIHGEQGVGKNYLVHHTLSQLEPLMAKQGIYIEKNEISASELFHGGVGESENAFKQLLISKPMIDHSKICHSMIKIIVIDDIDNILTSNSRYESGRVDRSMISELIHFFDIHSLKNSKKKTIDPSANHFKTILIGLTSDIDRIDGSLIRSNRFSRLLELKVPSPQQRLKILKFIISKFNPTMLLNDEHFLSNMYTCQLESQGFVWSDFVKLQSLIELEKMENPQQSLDWNSFKRFIMKCKPKSNSLQEPIHSSATTDSTSSPTSMQDHFSMNLAGIDSIIDQVKLSVIYPFLHYEKYVKLGIQAPKGMLIYGPNGTGKTLLATCIARECKANFISVQCPDILSKVVGESSKAIKQLFVTARQCAPCILFFDQFDAIARSRNDESSSNSSDKMLSTLLIEMDGVHQHRMSAVSSSRRLKNNNNNGMNNNHEDFNHQENDTRQENHEWCEDDQEDHSDLFTSMIQNDNVFILAATNRMDLLDSAVLRPGRIDQHIYLPLPNEDSRVEILKLKTQGMPIQDHETCIREMAQRTQNFSGADLDNLCREAAMLCLRENMQNEKITMKHFEMALQSIKK